MLSPNLTVHFAPFLCFDGKSCPELFDPRVPWCVQPQDPVGVEANVFSGRIDLYH